MTSRKIDERRPLLGADAERLRDEVSAPLPDEEAIVDFDDKGDPDNPLEWPDAFKWSIVALLACMAFTVTFTCISVAPVANRIVADLAPGQPSAKSSSILLVTIWELGEAAGPLLIAPLSEIYGRYPVLNAANTLFVAATALAALSPSVPLFIAARALTGLAVATNVLNPAVVGDMFASEQRGSPMSLIFLAPLIGGALGPAVSAAVAQTLGWRQVLWLAAAMAGGCQVLFLVFFRETYKVAILKRRAARLRAESGHDELHSPFEDDEKSWSKLGASVLRPAIVLSSSGILMALSLFGSIVFAYFYVIAVSLPDILETVFDLSPAVTGSTYVCFTIGSFISVLASNHYLDRIYIKLRDQNGGVGHPEYRLPLAIIGGFTLPLTIAMYGWAAELRLPLWVFLLSVALIGFTLLLAVLPIMAYAVDAFGLFSASAMTGIIVSRCLMSTFLPLVTGPLVNQFGYGWGFSVFSAVSFCIAPIPVLVMRYGAHWRQRSKYTREA